MYNRNVLFGEILAIVDFVETKTFDGNKTRTQKLKDEFMYEPVKAWWKLDHILFKSFIFVKKEFKEKLQNKIDEILNTLKYNKGFNDEPLSEEECIVAYRKQLDFLNTNYPCIRDQELIEKFIKAIKEKELRDQEIREKIYKKSKTPIKKGKGSFMW